jgi:hypothetical protein
LERPGEAANILIGQEKNGFAADSGIGGTIDMERRLRIKMNKAEIRELIPAAPVYPGVAWLLPVLGEQP